MIYYIIYEYEREVIGTQIIGDIEYKLPKRIETIECEEDYFDLESVIERYEFLESKYEIQELKIIAVDEEEEEELDWIYTNTPIPQKWLDIKGGKI